MLKKQSQSSVERSLIVPSLIAEAETPKQRERDTYYCSTKLTRKPHVCTHTNEAALATAMTPNPGSPLRRRSSVDSAANLSSVGGDASSFQFRFEEGILGEQSVSTRFCLFYYTLLH